MSGDLLLDLPVPITVGSRTPSPERMRRLAAHGIEERFPGVHVWHGKATGHWWAFVPDGDRGRLVEATDVGSLPGAIMRAKRR